jgi:hypothetical protein
MRFLVNRLTQLGLEPAGDSGFAQRVPMQKELFGPGTRITVERRALTAREDRLRDRAAPQSGRRRAPTKRTADGELVFVGYGLTLRTRSATTSRGCRSQGKVVVVVNGAPAGVDSAKRAELEGQGGDQPAARADPSAAARCR